MHIIHIPAFNDNYIWLLKEDGQNQCCVVDPGDAAPVLLRLNQMELNLSSILLTHHHHDHIGGVAELLSHFPECVVYAPSGPQYHFPHTSLEDAEQFTPSGLSAQFDVLALPGHTLDHLAYHSEGQLFVGDTLFSAGCGRLFEGSSEQMYHSLQAIAKFDPATLIYPAHEYTLSNLQFALRVEPQNAAVKQHLQQVSKRRQQGVPSLPTSLAQEIQINPFLRCHQPQVINSVQAHTHSELSNDIAVFTALRKWKDDF